jgi:GT2 family glycosyltransferase
VAWGLFYPEIRERADWGEDINFCLRWRAIGGKVWVWPLVQMEHIGRKSYKGCFGEWLLSREPEEVLEAAE